MEWGGTGGLSRNTPERVAGRNPDAAFSFEEIDEADVKRIVCFYGLL